MSHVWPLGPLGGDAASTAAGIASATSFMKVANDERPAEAEMLSAESAAALGSVRVPKDLNQLTRVVLVQVLTPSSQTEPGIINMREATTSAPQSAPAAGLPVRAASIPYR